ncbi:nucleotidyltransferase domain-containing protein [Kineococcus sp. NPDC059986]|uniref:nucleotidyltransferase domain-containing protein n=1 Tax=Kineococcus sp. NPDC059986 TaxID=3155538 RepID=UPI00344BF7D5
MNARALAVVTAYAEALRDCVGPDEVVGVYLTGSAVSGEFDESVSDIDVLTVHRSLGERLPQRAIEGLHEELVAVLPWAERLEVAYLPRTGLRAWGVQGQCLSWSAAGLRLGESHVASDDVLAAHLYAVVVAGLPTREVFPPVSGELFARQTQEYLADLLSRPAPGDDGGVAADRIANIARCLQRLATGGLGSKSSALRWWAARDEELAAVVQVVGPARRGEVEAQKRCVQGLAMVVERAKTASTDLP